MKYDGSYLWVLLNSSFYLSNPYTFFSILFLFMGRFLPIIALSPFFGSRILPHPVKVAFSLTIFAIFLPQLVSVTTSVIGYNTQIILLLFKEILVGSLIGLFMSMPFTIVQSAGIIIDHQRGGASLMVNDPTVQNQSSPLGTLFNMVLIFVFFTIDGPFLFLNAIMTSYEVIPPDKFLSSAFLSTSSNFWETLVSLFNKVMVISMQLASPALLAILMTDVFLGIANRLAPQVQITFLGMPLKSLLALVVVCFGWKLFNEELVRQCYLWLDSVKNLLISMASEGVLK